jgi:predicted DNA-binding protein with PD1-like motif
MEYEKGRIFLLRIPENEEFIKYLSKFAERKDIKMAVVSAIGSLKRAKLGYFNIGWGRYEEFSVEGLHELIIATGNISLKDGKPFPHIHALLGEHDGSTIGGHLIEGDVFVAEVYIEELKGNPMERVPHGNLSLWKAEDLSN